MGRQAFGTHMVYGETFFANPAATSSAPYPQELNPWSFFIYQNQFTHHRQGRMRIKHQVRIRDASPDRQPKNSVIPSEGDSSKNYGADQQRLQISDLHFDKFPTPATFACWKIRFKTEVCTCSQFPPEAICGSKKWRWLRGTTRSGYTLSTAGVSAGGRVLGRLKLQTSELSHLFAESTSCSQRCSCGGNLTLHPRSGALL